VLRRKDGCRYECLFYEVYKANGAGFADGRAVHPVPYRIRHVIGTADPPHPNSDTAGGKAARLFRRLDSASLRMPPSLPPANSFLTLPQVTSRDVVKGKQQ
jgi:hypothetical protein